MIYDIIPSQNVNYNDVRDTLAASGGSVNNTMSSLFAEAAKINKWSKYKPVAYPQPFTDNYPNWYKSGKGDCGYNIVASGNIRDSVNAGSWDYILPQGGESEPFRLGDFRGYNTKAVPFIKSQYPKGYIIETVEKSALPIIYTISNNLGSISLSDFDLSNTFDKDNMSMYVEVWNLNKTKLEKYQDGYNPISVGENTLEFNPAGLSFGYHRILFGLRGIENGKIIPIPYSDNNYYEFQLFYRNLASFLAQYNFYSIYAGSNTSLFYDNNIAKDVLKVTFANNFTIVFKVSVPASGATFTVPQYIYINTDKTIAREVFTRQETQSTVSPGSVKNFTYKGLIRDLVLNENDTDVTINVYLESGDSVGKALVTMKL